MLSPIVLLRAITTSEPFIALLDTFSSVLSPRNFVESLIADLLLSLAIRLSLGQSPPAVALLSVLLPRFDEVCSMSFAVPALTVAPL